MRVITSFNSAGHEEYGREFLRTFAQYWPKDAELVVFSEDKRPVGRPYRNVEWRDLNAVADLQKFRADHAHLGKITDYRFNALKFANKSFAIIEGTADTKDRCIWLDADTITTAPIDDAWLERVFPADAYLSFLGRYPMYTETGFLGFNPAMPVHAPFMEAFRRMYTTGAIFKLAQWHDCMAFDAVRIRFKLMGKQFNLNPDPAEMHPFVKCALGERMDHLKGRRKGLGASPERKEAANAHE